MTSYRTSGVVRFSETDASGRYHYVSAPLWAENAEHELYRNADLPASAFPRRAVSATFERPLRDGDPYTVELRVDRLGSTSVSYCWRVLNGDTVAVTGSHTVVHVGATGRPEPVPDALREALAQLV